MHTVGIVAEYNPFHTGHALQLRRIREQLGEDTAVVAALSGDFVQRGEAAAYSKFARAEAAVRGGVSLVLELPLPWCLSSAEGFARGGVGLLLAAGAVDTLSFGSECGDLALLRRCAEALEHPALGETLRTILKKGVSFAAARERAVGELSGEEVSAVLRCPNDLLAVEYLRAAARSGEDVDFLPVKRTGTRHDGPGSASELRARLWAGEDISDGVPAEAMAVFAREASEGRGPVAPEDLRKVLLSRLRERTAEDFAALPDAAEGIENRLYAAAMEKTSPEEIAMSAKSRRYALSRLRRMTLCAALGVRRGMAEGTPPYLRVLAMDEKGRAVLRKMEESARVPVIVKSARARELTGRPGEIFALGAAAHDLYVLGYASETEQTGGGDWRYTPYVG